MCAVYGCKKKPFFLCVYVVECMECMQESLGVRRDGAANKKSVDSEREE